MLKDLDGMRFVVKGCVLRGSARLTMWHWGFGLSPFSSSHTMSSSLPFQSPTVRCVAHLTTYGEFFRNLSRVVSRRIPDAMPHSCA